MSALLYIGMGQSIFLAMLIVGKRSTQKFDYLLAAWLLISALQLLFFHLNFIDRTDKLVPLLLMGGLLAFITGPLLYLYVIALLGRRPFRLLLQWYHLIPFVFFSGHFLYFHFADVPGTRVWVEDGYLHSRGSVPPYMGYYGLILAFFSCLYPALSLYLLFRHRRQLENRFSYTEKVSLDWLRNWIILSLIGFWISFIIIWAGEFQWVTMRSSFQIVSGYIVFNVMVIGYFGLKQGSIFTNPAKLTLADDPQAPKPKYASSSLSKDDLQEHSKALTDHMEENQPHLQATLTIDDLAGALGFTRHQLSQVINSVFGQNFFDFINEYRVREFEQRVQDEQYAHLTLLGIALDCGFNSKSSFNQIIKKMRGQTPSELRSHLKKAS
ncbi:MAG: AraC family transcriptional regulator [Bacteroidota bacterium]